jgi:hypothetical protein
VKTKWLNDQRPRPGAATNKMQYVDTERGIYRRTATGYGRTKKPGLHGTVKNPRLLKACMIISVISDISEFFDIFSSVPLVLYQFSNGATKKKNKL